MDDELALAELTAGESATLVKTGEVSAVELTEAALARIRESDGDLKAWVWVDAAGATAAARRIDAARARGEHLGALAGVPLGVKDVIDVAGMPTTAGFEPFASRVVTEDASVVGALKREGAVVVGKTATAQLAFADPPPTANPWDFARSPGGSSTGSGVAVAARHVSIALATQTGGSTLRPAAFTGCVGFKPTYGLVPTAGVFPLAWSLDHVGVIARSVEDCRLFLNKAAPISQQRANRPPARIRLGVLSAAVRAANSDVREAFDRALRDLEGAGAEVAEVSTPMTMEELRAVHLTVMQAEAAAVHLELFALNEPRYEPKMRAFVKVGRGIPAALYLHSRRLQARARLQFVEATRHVDALVLPTTTTMPPPRETTGASWFQAIFSLVGFPAVTIPIGLSAEHLPQAIQLAAAPNHDSSLLTIADWCTSSLGGVPLPAARRGGSIGPRPRLGTE